MPNWADAHSYQPDRLAGKAGYLQHFTSFRLQECLGPKVDSLAVSATTSPTKTPHKQKW